MRYPSEDENRRDKDDDDFNSNGKRPADENLKGNERKRRRLRVTPNIYLLHQGGHLPKGMKIDLPLNGLNVPEENDADEEEAEQAESERDESEAAHYEDKSFVDSESKSENAESESKNDDFFPLCTLPEELLLLIFKFLTPVELAYVAISCKILRVIVPNDWLWKQHLDPFFLTLIEYHPQALRKLIMEFLPDKGFVINNNSKFKDYYYPLQLLTPQIQLRELRRELISKSAEEILDATLKNPTAALISVGDEAIFPKLSHFESTTSLTLGKKTLSLIDILMKNHDALYLFLLMRLSAITDGDFFNRLIVGLNGELQAVQDNKYSTMFQIIICLLNNADKFSQLIEKWLKLTESCLRKKAPQMISQVIKDQQKNVLFWLVVFQQLILNQNKISTETVKKFLQDIRQKIQDCFPQHQILFSNTRQRLAASINLEELTQQTDGQILIACRDNSIIALRSLLDEIIFQKIAKCFYGDFPRDFFGEQEASPWDLITGDLTILYLFLLTRWDPDRITDKDLALITDDLNQVRFNDIREVLDEKNAPLTCEFFLYLLMNANKFCILFEKLLNTESSHFVTVIDEVINAVNEDGSDTLKSLLISVQEKSYQDIPSEIVRTTLIDVQTKVMEITQLDQQFSM